MAKVIKQAGKIGVVLMLLVLVFGAVFYVANRLTLAQTAEETAAVAESAPTADPFDLARNDVMSRIKKGRDLEAVESFEYFLANFSDHERFSAAVVKAASRYREKGNLEMAQELFQYVVANYQEDKSSFWAQINLVKMDIAACESSCLDDGVGQLLAQFAGDPREAVAAGHIADEYLRLGKVGRARALYRFVVDDRPDSENALWARMHLVTLDIAAGKNRRAQDGFGELLADHFEDERIGSAVCRIGNAYRYQKRFREAKEMYQYVLDEWPNSTHALSSRMGTVIADIVLGNDPNAEHGVNRLLSDFATDERVAEAALLIADKYQGKKRFKKARPLYEYVVDNWADSKHAIFSQKGLAVTEAFYNEDPNTYPALDRLLTDFRDRPKFTRMAFLAAEAYRDRALSKLNNGKMEEAQQGYARAATAWEQVIQRTPESVYTPESYYLLAECYCNLGEYLSAIDCYRLIVDTWPDWKRSWSAQFQVGYKYEQLKWVEGIEPSEADIHTKTAYQRLLDIYPDCPAAKAAAGWLSRHSN